MSIIIPIDKAAQDFNDFLSVEENSRILFSGKFGAGKTHFLTEFFEGKRELFESFHLYPINYQINSTDDIASLLKYDVIIELLKKNRGIFEENSLSGIKETSLLFLSWIKDRYTMNGALERIISSGEEMAAFSIDPITNTLAKLGRPLKDLLELDKEFQDFKSDYKAGDKGLIEKYISEIREKNINEPDYISNLVKEKILTMKDKKKSVLILDDLDRVDPEHIFRLLNLFSAFFERENENRFGFDMIIVVADYANLEHIFHHKYGAETDFSGYVNKFFTIAPYRFDNQQAVVDTVEEIVKSIKNENPELNDSIGEGGNIKLFVEHIFVRAVESQALTIRDLLKPTRFQFLELKKGKISIKNARIDTFETLLNISIKIVVLSFSSVQNFLKVLSKIMESPRRTTERMPFKPYISAMIKSLQSQRPEKSFYWKKHLIEWDTFENSFAKVDNGSEEALFYELLVDYVKVNISNYK